MAARDRAGNGSYAVNQVLEAGSKIFCRGMIRRINALVRTGCQYSAVSFASEIIPVGISLYRNPPKVA